MRQGTYVVVARSAQTAEETLVSTIHKDFLGGVAQP